jgi:hypothetical protein
VNVSELYTNSTATGWNQTWTASNWTTPTQIVSGDFNGDGKGDLAYLTSAGSGLVNVATLTSAGGSGGWTTAWTVSNWAAPTALAVGDFDGDSTHKSDLFWAYPSGGAVNVSELYSTGSAWSQTWTASGWTTPTQIVSGDFNADGKMDLAYLTSAGTGLVNVATLTSAGGSGGWTTAWTVSNWAAPTALVSDYFTGI